MNSKPILRFPTFVNEWQLVPLNKISSQINRQASGEEYPVLTISAGNGFLEQKDRFSQVIAGNSLSKYTLLLKDELAYNRGNSKKFTYGCIYRLNNYDMALVPNVYISFRIEDGIPKFYEYLFQKKYLDRQLRKLISSSARMDGLLNINKTDFFNVKVPITDRLEQEKIASFFSLIDKKIELQTEKVEELKKYKKGIMQKIFSQELRFKDDNGNEFPEWEEKKLGKVCEIKKGQQLNKEFLLPQGKYYALNGGVEPSGFTDKYNTERGVISISEGGNSCGYVKYNNERFWSGGHCYTLENTLDFIDSKYLFQFLKYNELKIMALRVGSGLPNIQKSALSNFIIKIPEYSEQLQIGNLLYLIDTKIIKEEEMLDLLNQYKKGLLQQMFV